MVKGMVRVTVTNGYTPAPAGNSSGNSDNDSDRNKGMSQ